MDDVGVEGGDAKGRARVVWTNDPARASRRNDDECCLGTIRRDSWRSGCRRRGGNAERGGASAWARVLGLLLPRTTRATAFGKKDRDDVFERETDQKIRVRLCKTRRLRI